MSPGGGFVLREALQGFVSEMKLFLHGLCQGGNSFLNKMCVGVETVDPKLKPKESTSDSCGDGS